MGNGLVVAIVYGTICVLVLVLAWMIFMRPDDSESEGDRQMRATKELVKFPPRLADVDPVAYMQTLAGQRANPPELAPLKDYRPYVGATQQEAHADIRLLTSHVIKLQGEVADLRKRMEAA